MEKGTEMQRHHQMNQMSMNLLVMSDIFWVEIIKLLKCRKINSYFLGGNEA